MRKKYSVDEYVDLEESNNSQSSFKSYISKKLKAKKIKITASSRHGYHIRFPLEKGHSKFFKDMGISVEDTDISISSKFQTYILISNKDLSKNIPKGTSIPWVNNHIGSTGQLFNNKDLNPDNLGLAGLELSVSEIIDKVKLTLESRYDKEVSDQLVQLMLLAKSGSNSIKIPNSISFSNRDLAKVSADFGEVLASIWIQKSLKFKKSFFPLASNEKLIDVYGIRFNSRFPISVKSGGGGKVTIQNIIDSIKSRAKTASMDHSSESSLVIFNIVNQNPMRQQMIMLHQYMETDAIKKLAELMGTNYKSINLDSLRTFVENKSNEELIEILKPFWDILGMRLTDKILYGKDKIRLIISPLGESIWKILNNSDDIKQSLNNVARQVMLIQVNCDVKTKKIIFSSNFFKEARFQFGWAGYSAGNKLGFKMKLVK
tara:strand:+ start:7028 stop:8320 length:1293 start_codon:yes stop_codon:yes gene_type:complete